VRGDASCSGSDGDRLANGEADRRTGLGAPDLGGRAARDTLGFQANGGSQLVEQGYLVARLRRSGHLEAAQQGGSVEPIVGQLNDDALVLD